MSVATVLHDWFDKTCASVAHRDEPPEPSATLQVGDFRLDLERRRAYVRGIRLELSSGEFNLLRYLVAHPKQLVTPRTELSTHRGPSIHKAEVMQTLMSLRKKLDDVSATHYLVVEPWALYQFHTAPQR